MTAALILTASSHTITCAYCNAPWPLGIAQCPGCGCIAVASITARAAAPSPDALRAQLAAVTAERDALRAIVEGRTTPPTDAEIAAHEATGGYFLFLDHDETGRVYDADALGAILDDAHRHLTRWWAHDANDAPAKLSVVA